MMTDEDKNEKDETAVEKAKLDAQLASGQLDGVEYNKQVVDLVVPEIDGERASKKDSVGYKIRQNPFFYIVLSMLTSIILMIKPAFFTSEEFKFCSTHGWPEGIGNCFYTAIRIPQQIIIILLLLFLPFFFVSVAKSKTKNTKYKKTLIFLDVVAFLLVAVSIVKTFWAF